MNHLIKSTTESCNSAKSEKEPHSKTNVLYDSEMSTVIEALNQLLQSELVAETQDEIKEAKKMEKEEKEEKEKPRGKREDSVELTRYDGMLFAYLEDIFISMLNQESIQSAKSEGSPYNRKEP